ncbi:MAG: NADH-quinone oxidoreductase subunit NuoF [Desulfomonile tiedjei]|nr:NADH-quinone oxidoreductase subunit NuoF [Desulfomonile tiedjei]
MERPLTRNFRPDGPFDVKEYEKAGGYEALRKVLTGMSPKQVCDEVRASNLRGRGGAGFPTGAKWAFMPPANGEDRPRYLIVDADEMEPGTFKDRLLMEGDPHQLIEGIVIGGFAVQADVAYIFLRWEYKLAEKRLRKAIAEAYDSHYLGRNILGTDFNLELYLHVSAGRYICGEGSALVNSMEGKRAIPVARPPQQTESGLWGRPTLMNNVETMCNVPHIVKNGAAWFQGLSVCEDGGTKIYGVSGKVKRPGAWELPMGTPLREILEQHAGGMRDGVKFRGVLPGGASTEFFGEEHLDVSMCFDSLAQVGSRLGTGSLIVLDDRTCPVGMLHNLETFFARESCGWCTPCREGLPWIANILKDIEEGRGQPGDLEILEAHTRMLWIGRTYCALAPGAMEPLKSALRYFRDDFERHIRDKRCPWR